jgi:NADH dehydrogenase FAD-containing subunit
VRLEADSVEFAGLG